MAGIIRSMSNLVDSSTGYTMQPVGYIVSDFPDKFGVPRQPGLAPASHATLNLVPPYDDPLTTRGLDAFSHLWLTFVFHHSPERWTPLVRPPRLGGNAKVGVFASRSTHRPNRLGLSLVQLKEIDTRRGVRLVLAGCDLVSGTPVLDIKPYLPWAEAHPEARAGFAPEAPARLAVSFMGEAEAALAKRNDGASLTDPSGAGPGPSARLSQRGRRSNLRRASARRGCALSRSYGRRWHTNGGRGDRPGLKRRHPRGEAVRTPPRCDAPLPRRPRSHRPGPGESDPCPSCCGSWRPTGGSHPARTHRPARSGP